jgi:hypothetical protein
MADYRGNSGNDVIDNRVLKLGPGDNIYGEAGDDRLISASFTNLVGGPGNDTLEGGGVAMAVYWSAFNPVTVDLEAGYAIDGEGGRDVLIGIKGAHGSGQDDRLLGDAKNNTFWPNGGTNYVDGRGGEDLVILTSDPEQTKLTKTAQGYWTYSSPTGSGELRNVELLQYYHANVFSPVYSLAGATAEVSKPVVVKAGDPQRIGSSYGEIATDYFKVTQFGFGSYVINEAHPAFYYPKVTDTHPAGSFSLDAHNMVTGDFNGDGLEDLAVIWVAFPHTVYRETPVYPQIFLNRGDGSFGPANEIISGPVPDRHMNYRAYAADFNGDGRDDLLIASMSQGAQNNPIPNADLREPITLLLSTPNGKLVDATKNIQGQEQGGVPEGYSFGHDMSIGDVNGDGFIDFYTNKVLMLNDGKGQFKLASSKMPEEARSFTYVMSSGMGDLDGDGIDDLVVAYAEGYGRYVFLSDGKGIEGARVIRLPEGPYGLANTKSNYLSVGDLTGDGRPDILIACTRADPYYQGQYLQLFVNKGNGVFVEEAGRINNAPFDKFHGEGELYLRDMNGDGSIDIVHATGKSWDSESNQIVAGGLRIFLSDGKGYFTHVDPSLYAYVAPSQLEGWGYQVPNGPEVPPRMAPIQLTFGPGVDLVGSVMTPNWSETLPNINQVTLFVSESIKPLGRGVNESLTGSANNDVFWGLDGNDKIDGGAGVDTAVFSDRYADVAIKLAGNTITVTTKTEGVDTLTNIEALRFADRTVTVAALKRDLAPANFSLITEAGFAGSVGGSGTVVGTTGFQEIVVGSRTGNIVFDPSFNAGGDIIRLPGKAADWTIQRTGSSAKFVSDTVAATIPIGTTGNAVIFADGIRIMAYSDGAFKIGSQSFSENPTKITAPAETTSLIKPGTLAEANARLILSEGAEVSVGGKVQVIGTSAGNELVEVLNGKVSFDPSFNGGGDVIDLPGNANAWSAVRSGSSMLLTKGNDSAVIPIGTTGTDLAFDNATRALSFANGQFKIGAQAIEGSTPATLMG